MKKILFAACCVAGVLFPSLPAMAQSPAGLSTPSREQIESILEEGNLSFGDKLSLKKILQGMQEKGTKVKADASLSETQKTAQIIKIRQEALSQTKKILASAQQKELTALLLPKS